MTSGGVGQVQELSRGFPPLASLITMAAITINEQPDLDAPQPIPEETIRRFHRSIRIALGRGTVARRRGLLLHRRNPGAGDARLTPGRWQERGVRVDRTRTAILGVGGPKDVCAARIRAMAAHPARDPVG